MAKIIDTLGKYLIVALITLAMFIFFRSVERKPLLADDNTSFVRAVVTQNDNEDLQAEASLDSGDSQKVVLLIEGVIGIGRFGRREGTDQRSFLGIYRVGIGNGFFVGRRSFYGRLGGQGKNIPAVLREPFFARFVVGIRFSVRVRDRVVFLVVFVSSS